MTSLAIHDDTPREAAGPPASALLLWAAEARQAAQIATSLARTSFVPASLRGKAEDITAAILAGQELGLRPMASLRSMDIIQGTPALRAHAMRGLVQAHGHKVWLEEQTPERVVMAGQRREADGSYGPVQRSTWTIARAAQLGLTGKDQWRKQPATMLTARATGEICRLVASDVLYAMPYAVEELASTPAADTGQPGLRVTAAEILAQAPPPAAPAAAEPLPAGDDPPEQPGADDWPATTPVPDGEAA
ncbi:MAG TPA: hypothetical protein VFM54_05270 [Micromonosporaceae bacterium]|nr:hypothetical protein [Micromonosporaceae bacterium]